MVSTMDLSCYSNDFSVFNKSRIIGDINSDRFYAREVLKPRFPVRDKSRLQILFVHELYEKLHFSPNDWSPKFYKNMETEHTRSILFARKCNFVSFSLFNLVPRVLSLSATRGRWELSRSQIVIICGRGSLVHRGLSFVFRYSWLKIVRAVSMKQSLVQRLLRFKSKFLV